MSIRLILYANERVTAIGRPSGTATTISVTATIRVLSVWASNSDQSALVASGVTIENAPITIPKKMIKKPTIVRIHFAFDQSSNFLITSQKNNATGTMRV